MKSLLAKIFNSGAKLSDLERRILDCVGDRLDSDAAALWKRQIDAINKVQRLPGGTEVNFYRMERGRPTFDSSLALANQAEELLIAKVSIKIESVALKAQVWCVRGFIFSIEYDGDAAYFEEAMAMDPPPNVAIACELSNSFVA